MTPDEALARIRDYDEAHSSAYWSTLATFVAHDRRYADAAAAMHVHVNTVRYRIDRLPSMFGLDLSDPATFLWVAVQLHDRKVLGARAIVMGAMSWLVAVAFVYGVLAWILASPVFPFYFVAAIAILLVPLARLSAAPLALAWSRHR